MSIVQLQHKPRRKLMRLGPKLKLRRLQLLVLNAGVMFQPYALSPQGYESTVATNHLGHFLLLRLLLPTLLASQPARVVVVSSTAHKAADAPTAPDFSGWFHRDDEGFATMKAYGASKLCNIYMAKELARRMAEAVTTAPGMLKKWPVLSLSP